MVQCKYCGTYNKDSNSFCSSCGVGVSGNIPIKRLTRSKHDQMVAGVCAGIAEYYDVDPTVVRLLFVLFIFTGGLSILFYIVLMIIIPESDH